MLAKVRGEEVIPQDIRDQANELWAKMNQDLDNILASLRLDMINRTPEDDPIGWLVNRTPYKRVLTDENFTKDMLLIAMYRLARYESDRPELKESKTQ